MHPSHLAIAIQPSLYEYFMRMNEEISLMTGGQIIMAGCAFASHNSRVYTRVQVFVLNDFRKHKYLTLPHDKSIIYPVVRRSFVIVCSLPRFLSLTTEQWSEQQSTPGSHLQNKYYRNKRRKMKLGKKTHPFSETIFGNPCRSVGGRRTLTHSLTHPCRSEEKP